MEKLFCNILYLLRVFGLDYVSTTHRFQTLSRFLFATVGIQPIMATYKCQYNPILNKSASFNGPINIAVNSPINIQ